MIRAMYTAASGMNAQQANIDNIAHNLANVNTSGFKKSRVEFEDLVYQQIAAPGTPTDATAESPIGMELGLGAKPVAISRDFASGNLRATNAPYDVAIEGRGFLRGDANADGTVDLSDAVATLTHLFGGGREPECMDASDADDSGVVEITDPIFLLGALFLGLRQILPPHPECGADGTLDDLGCGRSCP